MLIGKPVLGKQKMPQLVRSVMVIQESLGEGRLSVLLRESCPGSTYLMGHCLVVERPGRRRNPHGRENRKHPDLIVTNVTAQGVLYRDVFVLLETDTGRIH